MNTKILLIGALCLTIFSCKKDDLKLQKEPQTVTQSNSGGNAGDVLKFQKDIQLMAGENCEGYVILTIASNNQSYLDAYCKQYEKSKINLIPEKLLQNAKAADFKEADSANSIAIHMNLDHLVYKTTKKEHYAFAFSNAAGNEKVYSTTYNSVSAISFSQPVLAVSIYNEYRKPFLSGSGRNVATAQWTVHFMGGTEYPFASAYFDYHSNLDVQTFWDYTSYGSFPPFPLASNSTYTLFPYNYNLRYRARYNYSGPALPVGAIETNGIKSANGYNNTYQQSCPATLTVYAI